jgi:hypothetical protein
MRHVGSRLPRFVASTLALLLCCVLGSSCGGGGGGGSGTEDGNGRLWITNSATRAPASFSCDGTLPNTLQLVGVVCTHEYLDFDENGNLRVMQGPPIEFHFAPLAPGGEVLAGELWAPFYGRLYDIDGLWSDGTEFGTMCVAGEAKLYTVEVVPGEDLHVTLVPE